MSDNNVLLTRLEGESPAWQISVDMAKRAVWLLPLALFVGGFWSIHGILSSLYAVAIVVVNFLLAAWLLKAGGRISFAAMAGAALFGYLLRLGLIFLAVMLVKDASWVELVPLGIMLIVTHLGLLFWEMRFVSGSYAFPGLKPAPYSVSSSPASSTEQAA
ncbi:MAG TPA: ATP synthase subunit I [Acidimicrobiaceae bacterium]|jgi:hypothetical protein|nr:ATP synthase subunit I [Acidimicrobiaceae bacterium]